VNWTHTCGGSWWAGDYQVAGSRDLSIWEKPFALYGWRGHANVRCWGTYDTLAEAQHAAEVFEANKARDDGP
jgi:hypothetical protein